MKPIALALFLQLVCIQAFAQQSFNFGLQYGQRLNYRQFAFTGVSGISAVYTKPLTGKMDVRLSAALEATQPSLYEGSGAAVSYDDYFTLPVRIGLQPYVAGDKAFVLAETGFNFGFFPYDETGSTNLRLGLSLGLGGGYNFRINDRRYLQASLSYNRNPYGSLYPFSWLSVRLAYGFNWSNKQ